MKPAIFTVGVILLFCFTSCVFIVYDFQVQRRQAIVLLSANQNSAIVSSLFPSTVRDRLIAEKSNQTSTPTTTKKQTLKTFLTQGNIPFDEKTSEDVDGGYAYGSKPIADLFPETSIFFADLVGFTGRVWLVNLFIHLLTIARSLEFHTRASSCFPASREYFQRIR